ncbi:RNA polymerase sigma-70 factor [Chitinophaga defluvii]|uniref:RNA polymerase sigma-70 factor n=1 Tax=Chitinophaga defluvii TaxID=3163343 RepID=A0ABV2T1A5_9BACT
MAEAVIFAPNFYPVTVELTDSRTITLLAEGSEAAFEEAFKTYFKSLHAYACTILRDEVAAEEMVQNVFCKIWEKREQINVHTSLKSYLYRSVHNESMDYLKRQKAKAAHQTYTMHHSKHETDTNNTARKLLLGELEKKLHHALNELPQQCRTIFQMSRFEELKYQEIANQLGISVKTVENQMGKALKLMRLKLINFLPLVAFSFLHF